MSMFAGESRNEIGGRQSAFGTRLKQQQKQDRSCWAGRLLAHGFRLKQKTNKLRSQQRNLAQDGEDKDGKDKASLLLAGAPHSWVKEIFRWEPTDSSVGRGFQVGAHAFMRGRGVSLVLNAW